MNTKKHNQRKRRRGCKNLFWLVKSTKIGSKQLILYNRKPYKTQWYDEYDCVYYELLHWGSRHSKTFLKNDAIDKFPITHNDLVPVKLIIDNNNPDLLLQRKKDNLFIGNSTVEYVTCGKKIIELRYPSRISPKLFPEITKESGIIGVRIERYNEKEKSI